MKAWKRSILTGFLAWFGFSLAWIPAAKGGETISVLFEDSVEFNAMSALEMNLTKFHSIGEPPSDFVLFFNLFCEGRAGAIGGTEGITREVSRQFFDNGTGEIVNDMTICDFCECAGLEGQAFLDCHQANESCVTINNAHFIFTPLALDNLPPDPDFPEGTRVLFTMTEHDAPTECTGKFTEFCNQGTLNLNHFCTHVIDSLGNIVKSISSAYIFTVKQ